MLSDQHGGGAAFTPVAPPARQRSRVIVRQHSSDSIIGNSAIRTVTSISSCVFCLCPSHICGQMHSVFGAVLPSGIKMASGVVS